MLCNIINQIVYQISQMNSELYKISHNECTFSSYFDGNISEELVQQMIQVLKQNQHYDSNKPNIFRFSHPFDKDKLLFNGSIDAISNHFQIIDLSDNPKFNHMIDKLNDMVQELYLGIGFTQQVSKWPSQLKTLYLSNGSTLTNFPNGLEKLCVRKKDMIIEQLPESLNYLLVCNPSIKLSNPNIVLETIKTIMICYDDYENDDMNDNGNNNDNNNDPERIIFAKYNFMLSDFGSKCERLKLKVNIADQLNDTYHNLRYLSIHLAKHTSIKTKIVFPPNLKSLKIECCNYLHELDNLPFGLEKFEFITNDTYAHKFNNLPTSLIEFTYNNYNKFSLYKNELDLPHSVKYLTLMGCSNETIKNLPISIESVKIRNNPFNDNLNEIISFKLLPVSINTIECDSKCVIDYIPPLIKELTNCSIKEIKYFDWNLTQIEKIIFNVHFNLQIDKIKFPSTLKYIEFGNYFNSTISNLPDSVEYIKLGNHHKEPIEQYPANLKQIVYGKKFKHSISNLPDSVEKITITSKYDKEITKLPKSLKVLNINVCCGYKFMSKLKSLCDEMNIKLIVN